MPEGREDGRFPREDLKPRERSQTERREFEAHKLRMERLRTSPFFRALAELVNTDPDLKSEMMHMLSRKKEFTEGTQSEEEMHREMAAWFSGVMSTERGRTLLNTAIDRTVESQSKYLKDVVESLDQAYVPEVIFGSGPISTVLEASRVAGNPQSKRLIIERMKRIGGQFAQQEAAWNLNSKTRKERRGKKPIPGTGTNLNSLQAAPVQVSDLTGEAYSPQSALGAAVKINGLLNSDYMTNVDVVSIDKIRRQGEDVYLIRLQDNETNQEYELTTGRILDAGGIGKDRSSFDESDVTTQDILKEEEEKLKQGKLPQVMSFATFMKWMGNEKNPFPMKDLKGTQILIGAGDGGRTVAEALFGMRQVGKTRIQLDSVGEVVWIDPKIATNREDYAKSIRPRYGQLATEFPRKDDPNYASRIRPKKGRAQRLRRDGNDIEVYGIDEFGNEFITRGSHVIDTSGYAQYSRDIYGGLYPERQLSDAEIQNLELATVLRQEGAQISFRDRSVTALTVLSVNEVDGTTEVEYQLEYEKEGKKPLRQKVRLDDFDRLERLESDLIKPDLIDAVTIPGGKVPEPESVFVGNEPLATKLEDEEIYFVGANSRLPVTSRERQGSSAYRNVADNSAALFRYTPKARLLQERILNSRPVEDQESEIAQFRPPLTREELPEVEIVTERGFAFSNYTTVPAEVVKEQLPMGAVTTDYIKLNAGAELFKYKFPNNLPEIKIEVEQDGSDGDVELRYKTFLEYDGSYDDLVIGLFNDPTLQSIAAKLTRQTAANSKRLTITIPIANNKASIGGIAYRVENLPLTEQDRQDIRKVDDRARQLRQKAETKKDEKGRRFVYTDTAGREVRMNDRLESQGIKVGDFYKLNASGKRAYVGLKSLQEAQTLQVVGFSGDLVYIQEDGDRARAWSLSNIRDYLDKVESKPEQKFTQRTFTRVDGGEVELADVDEKEGRKIGDKYELTEQGLRGFYPKYGNNFEIAGFTTVFNNLALKVDSGKILIVSPGELGSNFQKVESKPEQKKEFKNQSGRTIEVTNETEKNGYKVGDLLQVNQQNPDFREINPDIREAKKLELVGFTSNGDFVMQLNGDYCYAPALYKLGTRYIKIEAEKSEQKKEFRTASGKLIETTDEKEKYDYKVGDKLKLTPAGRSSGMFGEIINSKNTEIVGFSPEGDIIIQIDSGVCYRAGLNELLQRWTVESKEPEQKTRPIQFRSVDRGREIRVTDKLEQNGYKVGDKFELTREGRSKDAVQRYPDMVNSQSFELVGFTESGSYILQNDEGTVWSAASEASFPYFRRIDAQPEQKERQKIYKRLTREESTQLTDQEEGYGLTVGDQLKLTELGVSLWRGNPRGPKVLESQNLEVVGFDDRGNAVIKIDSGEVIVFGPDVTDYFSKIESGESAPKRFRDDFSGRELEASDKQEVNGYKVGDIFVPNAYGKINLIQPLSEAKTIEILGFTDQNRIIYRSDSGYTTSDSRDEFDRYYKQEGQVSSQNREYRSVSGNLIELNGNKEFEGYRVGDRLVVNEDGKDYFREEIAKAKNIEIVGFNASDEIVYQLDGGICFSTPSDRARRYFEVDNKSPRAETQTPERKKFKDMAGGDIEATGEQEKFGYKVGDIVTVKDRQSGYPEKLEIAGFTKNGDIINRAPGTESYYTDNLRFFQLNYSRPIEKQPESAEQSDSIKTVQGETIKLNRERILRGFRIGDRYSLTDRGREIYRSISAISKFAKDQDFEIAGFVNDGVVVFKSANGEYWTDSINGLIEGTLYSKSTQPESAEKKIFRGAGGDNLEATGEQEQFGYKVGDILVSNSNPDSKIEIVGFQENGNIINRDLGAEVYYRDFSSYLDNNYRKFNSETAKFESLSGQEIVATGEEQAAGYSVGDKLYIKPGQQLLPEIQNARDLEIAGFITDKERDNATRLIIKVDGSKVFVTEAVEATKLFEFEDSGGERYQKYEDADSPGVYYDIYPVPSDYGFKSGDKFRIADPTSSIITVEKSAKEIKLVGVFDGGDSVALQLDGKKIALWGKDALTREFEKIGPESTESDSASLARIRNLGFEIGDQLNLSRDGRAVAVIPELRDAEEIVITGARNNEVVIKLDGKKEITWPIETFTQDFFERSRNSFESEFDEDFDQV